MPKIKWVAIKDRMPNYCELFKRGNVRGTVLVLVATEEWTVQTAVLHPGISDIQDSYFVALMVGGRITHWAPMPLHPLSKPKWLSKLLWRIKRVSNRNGKR